MLVTEGLSGLLDRETKSVHVTISEAADEGVLPFFESIGFWQAGISPDRYRHGVAEYVCRSSVEVVNQLVRDHLSRGVDHTLFGARPLELATEKTLLMSLKPQFAELILEGKKSVEFRRRFSPKHTGATVLFYVSNPVREFKFTARIASVEHKKTLELWSDFGHEGGVSKTTFDDYFRGLDRGYAIVLDRVSPVSHRLNLRQAQALLPGFRPPQSFQTIQSHSPLLRALGVVTSY